MWRKNILELLGWDTEMCMSEEKFSKIKPCVACLSHTSKWELFIFSLYKFHSKFKRGVLVMAPQYHEMLGKFAEYIDCIPSTRLEDAGLGFVKNTAKFMRDNKDKYDWIIIAPEGSLRAKEWRSGYYWLAKELGWEIRVTGLDFERLNTWISEPISSNKSKDKVEKFLKKQMSNIVPLNEDGQIVRVREHLQPTIVNYYNVLFISLLLISLSLLIVYIIRCIKC